MMFLFFLDSCALYVQFVETLIFTCINSEEGVSRKRLVELVFCTVIYIGLFQKKRQFPFQMYFSYFKCF